MIFEYLYLKLSLNIYISVDPYRFFICSVICSIYAFNKITSNKQIRSYDNIAFFSFLYGIICTVNYVFVVKFFTQRSFMICFPIIFENRLYNLLHLYDPILSSILNDSTTKSKNHSACILSEYDDSDILLEYVSDIDNTQNKIINDLTNYIAEYVVHDVNSQIIINSEFKINQNKIKEKINELINHILKQSLEKINESYNINLFRRANLNKYYHVNKLYDNDDENKVKVIDNICDCILQKLLIKTK